MAEDGEDEPAKEILMPKEPENDPREEEKQIQQVEDIQDEILQVA